VSGGQAIRIGTRGSALARAQTALVAAALEGAGRRCEVVIVETEGDRRAPDTAWGEGAFVAAIEQALLDGRVDVAIHSAKDVPTDEHPDLTIAAFLPRADARDVLVVRRGDPARRLDDLPPGARLGTDSPRRTGFIRARRPDLVVHPLHGNVDTRLRRLDEGETDALVLAAAGLERLGRGDRIAERLDPEFLPPAPGQGAIAVQVRAADPRTASAVAALDDPATRAAVTAERAFLSASGGGCRAPIGALARIEGDELVLHGGYTRPDGSAVAYDAVRGGMDEGARLGRDLAGRLGPRLPDVVAKGEDGAPPRELESDHRGGRPRVMVTRAAGDNAALSGRFRAASVDTVAVPAIAIEPAATADLESAARDLSRWDWVVVTSANGARAVLAALAAAGAVTRGPRWAAVGPATRRAVETGGVGVDFEPARRSAAGLAAELPVRPGDRVLLVRGDLADDRLPDALRERGAVVDDLVAYRTREAPTASRRLLRQAVAAGPLDAIVFASGSAVRGLVALADAAGVTDIGRVPAVCLGPETAREAVRLGFAVLVEGDARHAADLATRTISALAARPTAQGTR
jgi:hydroxymethylbilane synthase